LGNRLKSGTSSAGKAVSQPCLTGAMATAVQYWSKQCKHGQTKILNERAKVNMAQ